ncbi:MAG: RtcB family protein [Saprospiraceae bacterium]
MAKKLKLRQKDLLAIGYPKGKAIGIAINVAIKYCKKQTKEAVLTQLKAVVEAPEQFQDDPIFGKITEELIEIDEAINEEIALTPEPKTYQAYGLQHIEAGTLLQMDTAMRLPVTVKGALMPDAHQGYGLPIGGVLATNNAIIPYAVGMDIGCRMCLTVYDLPLAFLKKETRQLKEILQVNTKFGKSEFANPMDDAVLERQEFKDIKFLRPLQGKARRQIGSSGSGNHFVEFGVVEITEIDNEFNLPTGQYVGILSHSGSRGFGAYIARHYTQIAMNQCFLPKVAKHLAWLDLDSEAGMEYWLAMNLAGDYASACHAHIHHRLGKALGEQPIATIENHHNFAWKEHLPDGQEIIVHRKGATPAGKGVLGIIPGSMTAPAFIVRGKGVAMAINSASHGAGRKMSRTKAKKSTTYNELKKHLKQHQVELIGGGLDEAPFAYKDIHQVMASQQNLVDVLGQFYPKIVRMDR